MKLSDGIEQAIHSVLMLAALQPGGSLSGAALAEYHGVSASYLLKHLQALTGAGILASVSGPAGGYRLAREPKAISLLDILLALEGPEPAFRCAEIRQRGPDPLSGPFHLPCEINAAMLRAERLYRAELAKTSIADISTEVAAHDSEGQVAARRCAFLERRERRPSV